MPKRYELPDLRPRDLVRVATPSNPGGQAIFYLDAGGGGHWVHFDIARDPTALKREGWDLRGNHDDYTEIGRLRDVDEHMIVERWSEVEAKLRLAPPLQVESTKPEVTSKRMRLNEIPNAQAGDLFILRAITNRDVVMYFTAPDRALYLGEVGDVGTFGLTNAQSHAGNPLTQAGHSSGYHVVAHLCGVERGAFTRERWPETERRLRAATIPKIGDTLTREQVAALPAGAVTQALDNNATRFVSQWDGHGRGRVIGVSVLRLPERLDPDFDERPRPARLVALGTPMNDRKAIYQSLADQGFKPAIEVLARVSKSEPARETKAPVEISATGTMVQVGDMVETTEEALTALPVGAVVHLWDIDGWKAQARRGPNGFVWTGQCIDCEGAEPWGIQGRQAVVIALDCHDRDSAVKARDAFLARPYKGQEREAAMAVYLEEKISTEVKAALDRVSDVGLNDQTISAVSGAVDRVLSAAVTTPLHGFATDDFAVETTEMRQRREEWFNKMLAERPLIGYREPMPEITQTLPSAVTIIAHRHPDETEDAFRFRVGCITRAAEAGARLGDAPATVEGTLVAAEPSWLERAAEALRPVAAELAAETKAQTRQALALGGVEVARAAAHRGLAAAVDALAPQHAAKVVQVTQHPVTRWLENAALFLGARATGKPALAQVGLREVVKAPMEGAAGLLVQAASQVVGAVKGALVAADEAARVEQVTGQPEAAQVSAGG